MAIAEWPTTPLPPERFTTFTGTPSSFSRPAMKIRAMMSVPEAWQLPRIPGTLPVAQIADTSSGEKASPSDGK